MRTAPELVSNAAQVLVLCNSCHCHAVRYCKFAHLDWFTSAMVTLDFPPLASVRTILAIMLAFRAPPLTDFSVAEMSVQK